MARRSHAVLTVRIVASDDNAAGRTVDTARVMWQVCDRPLELIGPVVVRDDVELRRIVDHAVTTMYRAFDEGRSE